MTLSAAWTRIAPSVALSRSSLAAAIVGDTAYVFGGELKPRTPLDADVHAVNLKGQSLALEPCRSRLLVDPSRASADSATPRFCRWQGRDHRPPGRRDRQHLAISSRRVGVDGRRRQGALVLTCLTRAAPRSLVNALAGTLLSQLYLWGGRGGKAMTPSTGELWAFDTVTKSFSIVPVAASVEGEQPEDRSYHVLTSAEVRPSSRHCLPPATWHRPRRDGELTPYRPRCRTPCTCTPAVPQRAVSPPSTRLTLPPRPLPGSSCLRRLDPVAVARTSP